VRALLDAPLERLERLLERPDQALFPFFGLPARCEFDA
jgi:hypothetical protein